MRRLAVSVLFLIACSSKASAPAGDTDSGTFKYLPKDADLVGSVDLQALRGSVLWKQYQPKLNALIGTTLADVKTKCGFDPLETLRTLIFAGLVESGNGVFVIKGFERDALTKCLEQQVISRTKVTNDQGVLTLQNESGARNVLTFVDATTLVMQGSKDPTKESLQQVLASQTSLGTVPWFTDGYAKLPKGATIWFMMRGDSAKLAAIKPIGGTPKWLDMGITVTDHVDVVATLAVANPDEATKVSAATNQQSAQLAMLFDKLSITPQQDTVVLAASISNEKFGQLVQMFGAMFGGGG